ncbi:hypothetical protein DPMN_074843 [Dreissena polymorpha]|uniref:Peptidase A2 domain-containing protein n=1 Tax=Dreissena polymorpha TaxID=45954 RepID=A0A9D3YK07_DREPO|nr:hypothetical protein DPMN_074843 [Dreissena polymorpha]
MCAGVYVIGEVGGVPVVFTADTGACRTVLSKAIFDKLKVEDRPKLMKSACLKGANGKPLNEFGKAWFKIKLGDLHLEKELIVAVVKDDCILGMDILQGGENGAADKPLSRGVIRLDGNNIPCYRSRFEAIDTRRVLVSNEFIIPGMSETVIDVFVKRLEKDEQRAAQFIVEGKPIFH